MEGTDPVLAYPIAPPREVSRLRARAEFVGRGFDGLCFFGGGVSFGLDGLDGLVWGGMGWEVQYHFGGLVVLVVGFVLGDVVGGRGGCGDVKLMELGLSARGLVSLVGRGFLTSRLILGKWVNGDRNLMVSLLVWMV